jgi:hypothetical protein
MLYSNSHISNASKNQKINNHRWEELFSNLLIILEDKSPSLSFFADLFNIPLNRLNFLYT